jgi:hypothetical protein
VDSTRITDYGLKINQILLEWSFGVLYSWEFGTLDTHGDIAVGASLEDNVVESEFIVVVLTDNCGSVVIALLITSPAPGLSF